MHAMYFMSEEFEEHMESVPDPEALQYEVGGWRCWITTNTSSRSEVFAN